MAYADQQEVSVERCPVNGDDRHEIDVDEFELLHVKTSTLFAMVLSPRQFIDNCATSDAGHTIFQLD